jgi:2-polyprenyl-6-methoxyphenol hydroxylase-like FAD-dependent oxidoreductase
VMLNRGDYWQCGFVIAKGTGEEIRRAGLEAFRAEVARVARVPAERVSDIRSWEDVKLLTVLVDRLPTWYRPGLLCIGDAAHAMSPVGGVGINLAIQDAVAAANILAAPLREGRLAVDHLREVQRRRLPATRLVQRLQVWVQDRIVTPVLSTRGGKLSVPRTLRLLLGIPLLRRLPGRLVGIGVRPEHVRI